MHCGVHFLLCEVLNHIFPLFTVHVLVVELYPATPRHCPESRSVLFAEVAVHTRLKTCQCLDALPGNPSAPVDPVLVGSTVLA